VRHIYNMKYFKIVIAFFVLLNITYCKNNVDIIPISETFYENYKDSFLKSDLVKFHYDPRVNFSYGDIDSNTSFTVLIRKDSSLMIHGSNALTQFFNDSISTFNSNDIIISRINDKEYQVTDLTNSDLSKNIIIQNTSPLNLVDYFLNMQKLIIKFQILEIAQHPSVNTIQIVFTANDYLIYKPDSLMYQEVNNKDFMKSLFKNGKKIDKNWFQFSEKINTDYY